MKNIVKYPMLILFIVFIVCFTIFDMTQNSKKYSETENRQLSQKPKFTLGNFIDTSFSTDYTKYINDQFVLRDKWISLKSGSETVMGKLENNGVIYGKDGFMFEKLQIVENKPADADTNVVAMSRFDRSVKMVKEFLEKYDYPITVSIVPNSSEILSKKLPSGYVPVNQQKYIKEIYSQFPKEENTFLNFYNALKAHEDEYIYYRTDHHWTTLGAYYAYQDYCKEKGLTPVKQEELKSNEVTDFYGTYYNKAKMPGTIADTITWYDVPAQEFVFSIENTKQNEATIAKGTLLEEDAITMLSVDSMYDVSKFETKDKYAALMWGNPGIIKIKSDHNLDHKEGSPTRLLLIKDSYANSIIPYLSYNYDEIYIIDLRYFPLKTKFEEFLKNNSFTDIFLMYNFSTFIADDNLPYLRY